MAGTLLRLASGRGQCCCAWEVCGARWSVLASGDCSSGCRGQWVCEMGSIEASPVVLLVGAVGKLADRGMEELVVEEAGAAEEVSGR